MWILGVVNSPDSSAALLKDNVVIAAAQEERFSRIKMTDEFPANSINFVLNEARIVMDDIDVVTYGWSKPMEEDYVFRTFSKRAMEAAASNIKAIDIIDERIMVCLRNDSKRRERFKNGIEKLGWKKKIYYYHHHDSHAAHSYYCSQFDKALIFTADGRGDFKSITVAIGEGNNITEIDCRTVLDSMGYFYSIITSYFGFTPVRHEGKVTGLAAYGDPDKCLYLMKEMIDYKDGTIVSNIGKYFKPFDTQLLPDISKDFAAFSREDIAAAAQKHLEDVLLKYFKIFIEKYEIGNICLGGGVFQNVKLNQKIREIHGVDEVFIPPNMGDSGMGIGACLLYLNNSNDNLSLRCEIPNAYLGPSYSDEEIKKTLKEYGVKYYKCNNKFEEVASFLNRDKVIGWFQGRMEWGQRALGNRSILYHPRDHSVNDWLNKRLNRTEFMPFAPVTINDIAEKCYKGWSKDHYYSRFMLMTYDCTEEFKNDSPAVVHVDGTARPQIIFEEDNPHYYYLVKKYYEDYGFLSIINTSFNMHEEPIVNTPNDALKVLVEFEAIDILVIEDYIVEKR